MAALRTARSFLSHAPREALLDTLGLGAAALLIFAGFLLPGLL
ncbi:hypothetical protein LNKW23_36500 [Paralimibaculum aggregatum]|uniref:Uncharacterized protein n=1 Tax=Paralimibaculum aggregatum TaxID=3036245 RepID=A0ABQ6LRV4_9RHOB|nr:hypothetical protein [Limibaculum sp. NKW23]GMG84434.1 hypothetical protein LNKW23_36500 [Limibaculum sp. NKW23]